MNDVLNDALSNLEHDNYERSHKGYKDRQADVALIRAALSAQKADGGDAPWADWMGCESRRPFVMNTLRSNAEKMRSAEKRARTAYRQDFMGAPCRYLAAVYGKAAALFEAQIAAIDAALAATKGESNE